MFLGEVHRHSWAGGFRSLFLSLFQGVPVTAVTGRRLRPITISGIARSAAFTRKRLLEQLVPLIVMGLSNLPVTITGNT